MSEKIFTTKNFCCCRLCRGSERIETVLDREAFLAFRSGSHRQVSTDCRYPVLVTFPADCTVVWWSAAGNPDQDIDRLGQEILRLPASIHGCWKIRENQEISIHAPVQKWDVEYEKVETRQVPGGCTRIEYGSGGCR